MTLTTVNSLQVLDLSNNQLEGDIPVNGSLQLFTPLSFGDNPHLRPIDLTPGPVLATPPGNSATGVIAAGVGAAVVAFTASAIALAYYYWKRIPLAYCWKRRPPYYAFDVYDEEELEAHFGQLKKFPLRELQVATDNFNNKNILGRGGFGKVYKGRLNDGSLVAVKRLKKEGAQGGELQFLTEVKMISLAVHRNLLRLHGFCMTPTERLLVPL